MLQINKEGKSQEITIGANIFENEYPQVIAPKGVWQGTRLKEGASKESWALLGCTVSPGFDYENFHIESREELSKRFPHLIKEIKNIQTKALTG